MREIKVEVTGQFIRKSSKLAGVQGEGNVTRLILSFDSSWENCGKRIIWRNARGLNPVSVILGGQHMTGAGGLEYAVLIPPEPLEFEGWCSFTVEGHGVKDGTSFVSMTVSDMLEVEKGENARPSEPTVSQALQLQREIDAIMGGVTEQAQRAETSGENAKKSEVLAETYALAASRSAGEAQKYSESAGDAELFSEMSESWAAGGTGIRAGEDQNNARYWAQQAAMSASPGVRSFMGRTGNVVPQSGDYTKAQVGLGNVDNTSDADKPLSTAALNALKAKAASVHRHSPSDIESGVIEASVSMSEAAQSDPGKSQLRNIYAGTADMTPGVSALTSGSIYLVWEESQQ